MAYPFYPLKERYVNLLTDFGFKRVFGTEPNKGLLVDFLNTLLPPYHKIQALSYKSSENVGNTPLDRKAIFDIYCQGENGDRFIVEIQKAKQNYFKDRSVFYASFPIQEQALIGEWNFKLAPVYSIGVLDFVFDDHKNESTIIHTVELKDQHCNVFYEKLKFIYIELPKFNKTIEELESHQDKWLYLFRHLPELEDQPQPFQDPIFLQLFDIAEIANFSRNEQTVYQNSLKYYRDMTNVVNTSRMDGVKEGLNRGRAEGRAEGRAAGARSLLNRMLTRTVGDLTADLQAKVNELSPDQVEVLGEALLDFSSVDDLLEWLNGQVEWPNE
ncbi:MAG: hypothetical protein DCF15_10360 [Phormidesmis priestleyi]|uniref:DUF4351 domain-containing protein n=1 Tax=Phormidesmis priestleyi TaxID=268141 RepID=A0A2W4XE11_9CYAN|nr:MAG: hypothetical protein DCF15_10360 [Phormidesmis priestleyi]